MSYLTRGSTPPPPSINPEMFQKALQSRVQRHRVDDSRQQWRQFSCMCGTVAMVVIVVLLVYASFTILTDDVAIQQPTIIYEATNTNSDTPVVSLPTTEEPTVTSTHTTTESVPTTEDKEHEPPESFKGLELFCGTEHCSRHLALFQAQLDPIHNPCRNLYDHVCSRWERQHQELASLERPSGSYTVDDAVLDDWRERLTGLLLSPECPYPAVCSFFNDCARGNLTRKAELEALMSFLKPSPSSEDAIATAIVQMARIGVSPFFEVRVTVHLRSRVRVDLVPPVTKTSSEDATVVHTENGASAFGDLLFVEGKWPGFRTTAKVEREARSAGTFFAALKRQMCLQVKQALGGEGMNCSLSADSGLSPPWDYEWYRTIGMSVLAREAKRRLSAAWLSVGDWHVDESSPPRDSRRSEGCLTLMGQYDPYLLSYISGTSAFPRILKENADSLLLALQNTVVRKIANDTNFSLSLGLPHALRNRAALSRYQADLYGRPADARRLLRLLRNSTWKRWRGQLSERRDAFAPSPFNTKASTRAYVVPLTLFNATALNDPWLTHISLARTVSRILRTISSQLATKLNKSRLAQCVPLSEPSRGQASPLGSLEHGGVGKLNHDLNELASFHAAFHFYRRYVGLGLAVKGTKLNSDLLFLLYYVYNMCEALAMGLGGQKDAAKRSRRERANTLANFFATIRYPTCEVSEQFADCDVESEDLLSPIE